MEKSTREVLESTYAYMQKWLMRIDEIIEKMKDGVLEDAEDMTDGLEGVTWLADIMQNTHDVCKIEPDYAYIENTMKEILDGVGNSNYKFVAEVLEDEFLPMVAEWFDAVEEALEGDEQS